MVIPKEVVFNNEIVVSELEEKLIPAMIDKEIIKEGKEKCGECRGTGEVKFKYHTPGDTYYLDGDCPVCEGTGNIENKIIKKTGEKIPDPLRKYKMFGVAFSYEQLSRLVTACKMMGIEKITRTFGTERHGNLFRCGDASILLMPVICREDVPEQEFTTIFE